MDASSPIILPLCEGTVPLRQVGGKGYSLAKLASAGLPVPPGFVLSTEAYRCFVDSNELQSALVRIAADATLERVELIARASDKIRSMFDAACLPAALGDAIEDAYSSLGNEAAVSVRSSATAEDLPDLSFAGQHETDLNVRGLDALVAAIRRCWSSLWTPRAISYRKQMKVDHEQVEMAVVIQLMVDAEVSGIMFTANPLDGDRSVLVVNSSLGLGEAVVGGDVTPDRFVLGRDNFEVKDSVIGDKEWMITAAVEQGIVKRLVPAEKRIEASVSAATLADLAVLAIELEDFFDGVPQDVEWSVANGEIWLLQSRPITNLPPPPLDVEWQPPSKGSKLIRRQVVENMPDPLSPLFDDLYLHGGIEESVDDFMDKYGFTVDIDAIMERPYFMTVNGYAYARGTPRLSWRSLWLMPKMMYVYLRGLPRLFRTIKSQWQEDALPTYLRTIRKWKTLATGTLTSQQLLDGIRELTNADAKYWFSVSIVVGAAKVTDGLLHRFLQSWFVPGNLTSGAILRGFPSKTLEAQVQLEAIAKRIRDDVSLSELFRKKAVSELRSALSDHTSAVGVQSDIEKYVESYGGQVYNLDFAEPTLGEDPAVIFASLRTLVIDREFDTSARQNHLVQERDAIIDDTVSRLGPARRTLFRKLLSWAQSYGPCREESLFYMGAAWSTLRQLSGELGRRLVETGVLTEPIEVYFLTGAELQECCNGRAESELIRTFSQTARKRHELRERRKRLHAPPIIPVGSSWKIGPFDMSAWETQKRNAAGADVLQGFAVSPGIVTGIANVVLAPSDFDKMQPGCILVCPTTTPAWTLLFGQSLALVTDIGGILAHGSIVAREYGIPAVLGTGDATRRIATGQRITVDGDAGTVAILN